MGLVIQEFRRPIPIETTIRAEGWIVVASRRIVDTAARIVDVASGTELAAATGVYVAPNATPKREIDCAADGVRP